MRKVQLEQILQEGEGTLIEFKQSLSSSLAKEIVAFANTAGGRIFIGIDDNNNVIGCPLTNRTKSDIQVIGNSCTPQVPLQIGSMTYNDKEVIIIKIPESRDKPVQCSEGFFLRKGATSQKMDRDEIFSFAEKAGRIRFENRLRSDFKYPRDFDKSKCYSLLKRMEIARKSTIEDILSNLGFGEYNGEFMINNAGILFFGRNRQLYLRQAYVTCILYKGNERVIIIDRKDFRDDPVTDYENAFKFLQQHLRLEYEIKGGGPRKEIPEIPYEALKEALLNAIIHRDYLEEGARVMVDIFDDRVEISNPGGLLFDRRKFGHKSMARNPVTFDMFNRLDMVEKAGSGINRIKRAIKERGLKVKFDIDDSFTVIFPRPTYGKRDYNDKGKPLQEAYKDIKNRLTKNEIKVLVSCSKKSLSSREIALELGHGVISGYDKKILNKLVSDKLLVYTIPDKPDHRRQKYSTSDFGKKAIEDT